jgi:hypothetical protein
MASLIISASPPIRTLLPAHAFPYHSSRLETLFFSIPPEIRHQIYSDIFNTPTQPFKQETIKGWRKCPETDDLSYNVNGTQLLSVNRRMRAEALPVLYRSVIWRLRGFPMLRKWLNSAIRAGHGASAREESESRQLEEYAKSSASAEMGGY